MPTLKITESIAEKPQYYQGFYTVGTILGTLLQRWPILEKRCLDKCILTALSFFYADLNPKKEHKPQQKKSDGTYNGPVKQDLKIALQLLP
ncbi:MAG: hypothetical protein AAF765_06565 [Bacteroidota bacterium]